MVRTIIRAGRWEDTERPRVPEVNVTPDDADILALVDEGLPAICAEPSEAVTELIEPGAHGRAMGWTWLVVVLAMLAQRLAILAYEFWYR